MKKQVLLATLEALRSLTQARFFRTERGYHGRFYCLLQGALEARNILGDDIILEMEYQKSARHHITQRPDIVLHTPAELRNTSVNVGNLAVFALKHRASLNEALDDFNKLDEMFEMLRYQLGIFINIDSAEHHIHAYHGRYGDRIHSFGVQLMQQKVIVTHACWVSDHVIERRL